MSAYCRTNDSRLPRLPWLPWAGGRGAAPPGTPPAVTAQRATATATATAAAGPVPGIDRSERPTDPGRPAGAAAGRLSRRNAFAFNVNCRLQVNWLIQRFAERRRCLCCR